MDGLLEGLGDGCASFFMFNAMTGNGRGNGNDGCGPMILILLVIGLILSPFACMAKKEPKPIISIKSTPEQVDGVKKETLSHKLGRKTKDSVIEFTKGVIGK